MRPVCSDPRFIEAVSPLGFVDYGLETDQWREFCKDVPYDCETVVRALKTPTDSAP